MNITHSVKASKDSQSTYVFLSNVKCLELQFSLRWSLEFLLLKFWLDVRWKLLFCSPSTLNLLDEHLGVPYRELCGCERDKTELIRGTCCVHFKAAVCKSLPPRLLSAGVLVWWDGPDTHTKTTLNK